MTRFLHSKLLPAAAAMAAMVLAWGGGAFGETPGDTLQQALADPGRAGQRADDGSRHPAALVALADIQPGQRVLDLIPGSGYWTRIFSKMVGPSGRVYAVWPQAYANHAAGNVRDMQALSASPGYRNVVTLVESSVQLTAPEPLDVIWTSQNYHDYNDKFMGAPGSMALARAAAHLLKTGGLFIVIDHAAIAGHGVADTDTLHRIDRDTVIQQARAAGFRLVGESDVLHNPNDPRSVAVFDPSIRGHTDQFALKFRKL